MSKFLFTLALLCLFLSNVFAGYPHHHQTISHGKFHLEAARLNNYPYTMFKDAYTESALADKLDKVIQKIHYSYSNHLFFDAYRLYVYSRKGYTVPGVDNPTEPSDAARNAKNAAFVYLLGVDTSATPADIKGTSPHTQCKTDAINMLLECNIECKANENYWRFRSADLIMYLQAYDLLKGAQRLGGGYGYSFSSDDNHNLDIIKYKLQAFTRNLVKKSNGMFGGALQRHNNLTLTVCGALGLASVVLNDCSDRRWKLNWQPYRWASIANYEINNTLWEAGRSAWTYFWYNNSQISDRTIPSSGYAEGPHFFEMSFENLCPFFVAFNNYRPSGMTSSFSYRSFSIQKSNQDYLVDDQYLIKLMQWYNDIVAPNGMLPHYDDTPVDEWYTPVTAVTGIASLSSMVPIFGHTRTNLEADYIANATPPALPFGQYHNYLNINSGDVILRTPYDTPVANSVYLHINAEQGTALQGGKHEHGDATSFELIAGNEILAMDPPYINDDNTFRDGDYHNVVKYASGGPDPTENTTLDKQFGAIKGHNGLTIHMKYSAGKRDVYRTVAMYDDYNPYFVINDKYVVEHSTGETVTWALNGNGSIKEGTFALYRHEQKVLYTHPCSKRAGKPGTYNLLVCAGSSDKLDSIAYITYPETDPAIATTASATEHGNINDLICNTYTEDGINFGRHTRLVLDDYSAGYTRFCALLYPYKCNTAPPYAKVGHNSSNGAVYIILSDTNTTGDTIIKNVFVATSSPISVIEDPFDDGKNITIHGSGGNIFTGPNTMKWGYCISHTKFRLATLDSGTLLQYGDTNYIECNKQATARYRITGKMKYSGTVLLDSSQDSVTIMFFLPDYPRGVLAVAQLLDGTPLHFIYDSITRKITITFPKGSTDFEIVPAERCTVDCFFPPSYINIDSTFDFNTGTEEVLGHDVSVQSTHGWLRMTGGSKINICPTYTLINQDSITLQGYYDEQYGGSVTTECGDGVKKVFPNPYQRMLSNRSMIIINDQSALVLENDSRTYVGVNSTILVKSGGTLLIKNGAHVEIGGQGRKGMGEIIAEPGSYVCIEADADIHFCRDTIDSVDKNIFFISNQGSGVTSGVNASGGNGKFASPGGIYSNSMCIPLCSLEASNNYHSIWNKKYGWSNINTPVASFLVRDTFCYGDTITVVGWPTLNETKFRYEICEWDTTSHQCIGGITTYLPTTWDTGSLGNCKLNPFVAFTAQHNYRIKLIVENDCGVQDDTSKIIYVKLPPSPSLLLADSACPGVGTVIANGGGSTVGRMHVWSVYRLDSLSGDKLDDDSTDDKKSTMEASYTCTGVVSSSFAFPGYRFIGGYKYIITLTLYDFCGIATLSKTIWIPLSATIDTTIDTIVLHRDGLGSNDLILKGKITGAKGYAWSSSPSSTLAHSLIITVSPTVSTTYRLVATDSSGCSDTDSVVIIVKHYANAGRDTIICLGDSVRIGTHNPGIPAGLFPIWKPDSTLSDTTVAKPYAKPTRTTTYTVQIEDGGFVVESDDVTVWVDSIPHPSFTATRDSGTTICFDNESTPISPDSRYLWTFGDGTGTSTKALPCHTFPLLSRDTFYVVTLKVTNACGDSTIYDTVAIPKDTQLTMVEMVSQVHQKATAQPSNESATQQLGNHTGAADGSKNAMLLDNIPNPFNRTTKIRYTLPTDFKDAELVVYDMVGRIVSNNMLPKNSEELTLDCGTMGAGIYYYTLIVDHTWIGTRKMVIQR